MTRQNRLLVSIVAIGLAGVAALALLARRIESRWPQAPRADGAPAKTAASSPADPAKRVQGFIAVRAAERAVVSKHPIKFKQIEAALTGRYDLVKGQRMASDVDVMSEFMIARIDALPKTGLSAADYVAVRDAYRAWKAGGAVDPGLAGALEARRADLSEADLGGLETLDDRIK